MNPLTAEQQSALRLIEHHRRRAWFWTWLPVLLLLVGALLVSLRASDRVAFAVLVPLMFVGLGLHARSTLRALLARCPRCAARFFDPWNSVSLFRRTCRNCGLELPHSPTPPSPPAAPGPR